MCKRRCKTAHVQAGLIAVTAALLSLGRTDAARADQPYAFVQIICAPQLQYASVRRLWVYNLQEKGPYLTEGRTASAKATQEVERRHAMYTSRSLERQSQRCELPASPAIPGWGGGRASISLIAKAEVDQASEETSLRRIADEVQVFLFGKLIAKIGMNSHGITAGDDSVEVFADGPGVTIRKCSIVEPGSELRRCTDEHRDAPAK